MLRRGIEWRRLGLLDCFLCVLELLPERLPPARNSGNTVARAASRITKLENLCFYVHTNLAFEDNELICIKRMMDAMTAVLREKKAHQNSLYQGELQ